MKVRTYQPQKVNHYFNLFNRNRLTAILGDKVDLNALIEAENHTQRIIEFCSNPMPSFLKFKN